MIHHLSQLIHIISYFLLKPYIINSFKLVLEYLLHNKLHVIFSEVYF